MEKAVSQCLATELIQQQSQAQKPIEAGEE